MFLLKCGWGPVLAGSLLVACSNTSRSFTDRSGGGGGIESGGSANGGAAAGGTASGGQAAASGAEQGAGEAGETGAAGGASCDEPGGCSECDAGSRCSGGGVETCVDGRWSEGPTCSGETPLCVGGACAACAVGTRRCLDEVTPELCNSQGHWEPDTACGADTPVCHAGSCVTCRPGSPRCTNNTPEACSPDGSEWLAGEVCSGDSPACIAASATCGRCTEGEQQCDGSIPQHCDALGVWVPQSACAGAFPMCLGGECVQCDPAEGNGRRCGSEDTPQVCSPGGTWQNEATCTGATPVCREQTGRCACLDDATRCVSNTPQRCVNGSWVNQPACTGDNPVCLTNGSCGCSNDAERCLNSSTPQRCAGNQWESQAACSGEAPVCSGGDCVCTEGAERCSGGASRQRCSGGTWQATTACTDDTPVCHGAGVCGCQPGAKRCDSPRVVASCGSDYDWNLNTCGDYFACNGENCTTGPSAPGYVTCTATEVCDVGEQCCYDAVQGTGACQAQAPTGSTCARNGNEFELDCDGPSDCDGGKVCCRFSYMRFVTSCLAPSECTGTGAAVVCSSDQGAQNPSCASGQTCQSSGSQAFPYLSVCK